jgi:MipA family protein
MSRSTTFRYLTQIALFLGVAAPSLAAAQEISLDVGEPAPPAQDQSNRTFYQVGLGFAFTPQYAGSDHYVPVPLWNLRADNLYHPNTYVQVFGSTLRSNLLPDENLRLGVVAEYVFKRKNVDDPAVARLGDTRDGALLGATLGYAGNLGAYGALALEVDGRYDVAGQIGGLATVQLNSTFRVPNSRLAFFGGPALTYASADYMSEFFGVPSDTEAESELSEFDAGAGFRDVAVTVGSAYALNERLAVNGVVNYARLLGDAAKSPISEKDDQISAGMFVSYGF